MKIHEAAIASMSIAKLAYTSNMVLDGGGDYKRDITAMAAVILQGWIEGKVDLPEISLESARAVRDGDSKEAIDRAWLAMQEIAALDPTAY